VDQSSGRVHIVSATKSDCRVVARLMVERRADEPGFRKVARRPLQRLLYERWAAPGFLQRTADTFRADLDGEMAGYLVLLYDHPSVVLLDVVALEGHKNRGIEQQLMAHAEGRAKEREYPYLRAGLAPDDPYITPVFQEAGFQPLEYRRWEFEGTVQASEAPEGVTMRPVVGQAALDQRKRYLEAELDEAEPEGRELIEATFIPKRPSVAQSFVVSSEGDPIGYISVKKEAKTYTMGLSLLPEHWGAKLEAKLVAALPTMAARASQATLRLRVDTTEHAEASAAIFSELGLQRGLVDPDIWFKTLQS
jgi:GNAT superfamily N-acetyltransferase